MSKKWYTSKTLWFNVTAIVAGLITNAITEMIKPYIQVGTLAVINVILRIVTSEGIEF